MRYIVGLTLKAAVDKARSLGWKQKTKLVYINDYGQEVQAILSVWTLDGVKRPTIYVTECFKKRADYVQLCSVFGAKKAFIRYV